MKLVGQILVGVSLVTLSGAAAANDSTAALGAGGIVLTPSAAITLVDEDLFISEGEIRVHYLFRNNTAEDVDTLVAFPLPTITFPEHYETPVQNSTDQIQNFIGFRVWIDGQEIEPQYESRSSVEGRDVTDLLARLHIPPTMFDSALYETLEGLSDKVKQSLTDDGVIYWENGYNVEPLWTTTAQFYWQQHFPAGQTVEVEHRYAPIVGYGFFGESDLDEPEQARYWSDTCIDHDTEQGIRRLLDAQKTEYPYLNRKEIAYILTTANNWAGPIGTFHLVVDKGDPAALVSFCAEGVRKISPTRFEATYHDWSPAADLRVLILTQVTDDPNEGG